MGRGDLEIRGRKEGVGKGDLEMRGTEGRRCV